MAATGATPAPSPARIRSGAATAAPAPAPCRPAHSSSSRAPAVPRRLAFVTARSPALRMLPMPSQRSRCPPPLPATPRSLSPRTPTRSLSDSDPPVTCRFGFPPGIGAGDHMIALVRGQQLPLRPHAGVSEHHQVRRVFLHRPQEHQWHTRQRARPQGRGRQDFVIPRLPQWTWNWPAPLHTLCGAALCPGLMAARPLPCPIPVAPPAPADLLLPQPQTVLTGFRPWRPRSLQVVLHDCHARPPRGHQAR